MRISKKLLFWLLALNLPFILLALTTAAVEGVAAALLYVKNDGHFTSALDAHWLFGQEKDVRVVYKTDHRGQRLRRDPIPFDPYTVWRFVEGNVFWGLEIGEHGYVLNKRKTARSYRPEADANIFIVGGSTVAGGGATSNSTTIAAFLERQLSRTTGQDINVVNAGVGGWWSRQELSWFVTYALPSHHIDAVIFFDGYNDSWRSTAATSLTSREDETDSTPFLVDPHTRRVTRTVRSSEVQKTPADKAPTLLRQILIDLPFFNSRGWFTTQLLLVDYIPVQTPATEPVEVITDEQIAEVTSCESTSKHDLTAYESAVRTAVGAAASHEIEIFYVLQPSIVFKKTLTPAERRPLHRIHEKTKSGDWASYGVPAGSCYFKMQRQFFVKARELFIHLTDSATGEFANLVDLSDLFAHSEDDIFYTYAHYTDRGNQEIAAALAALLMTNEVITTRLPTSGGSAVNTQ